jgi:hypothetical protein
MGALPEFLGKAVVHEKNATAWELGKGALSANVYFFGNHCRQSERLQIQLWVEGCVDDEMVEKIC